MVDAACTAAVLRLGLASGSEEVFPPGLAGQVGPGHQQWTWACVSMAW